MYASSYIDRSRLALATLVEKTNALSPLSILSRGYSIAEKEGSVIKGIGGLKKGDDISLILSDGVAKATITDVTKEN